MSAVIQGISEILEGRLYMGSRRDARDLERLRELGITHILNVTTDEKKHFKKEFTYLRIPVDDGERRIGSFFDCAYRYIEEGEVVFVHSGQGVSRSATIVIAYLMRNRTWNYDTALQFVKERREIVNPHPLFVVQLQD